MDGVPTTERHLAGVTGVSLAQHCMTEAGNDAAAVQGVPHKLLHLCLAGRLSNLCAVAMVVRFQALLYLSQSITPPLPCWASVPSVSGKHGS